jgi:transcriptional regulator with XRE-family HTH domain
MSFPIVPCDLNDFFYWIFWFPSKARKMRSTLKAKSLGHTLRKWRQEAGLSQRAVAALIGVNASHIANIEGNKRKPSIFVLSRIASLINVDARAMYLLVWPEASELVGKTEHPTRIDAWRLFSGNRSVLRRWSVSNSEMRFLRQLNQLGVVTKPTSYFFVLNSVRQAIAPRERTRVSTSAVRSRFQTQCCPSIGFTLFVPKPNHIGSLFVEQSAFVSVFARRWRTNEHA